ncbi:MAG TPA: SDR family oxidoreductase [Acidimicrobiia bacterium]|nr:SDR family oxidoreductase [Acidimicrobiia bacterium]
MKEPEGRVALVTGASRGLGLAVVGRLAENGWRLLIDAREAQPLEAARRDLAKRTETTAIPGDISDRAHRSELVGAVRRFGRLDALINNASTLGPSPRPNLADYDIADYRRVLEVNVVAPLALTQDLLPLLRGVSGTVINVTSDAGREQYEGWGGYGSSKSALDQITNILAAEETGLSVYSFDPGDMNTRMHQEAFPGEDISDRPDPEESASALLRLIAQRPPSGHYRASDLLASA